MAIKNGGDRDFLEEMQQVPGYHSWSGEKKLSFAVLQDALETYQKYALPTNLKGWKIFKETEAWIWDDDQEWSFSFRNVCELFGLDPAWIRAKLLSWYGDVTSPYPRMRADEEREPDGDDLEAERRSFVA